MNAAEALHLLTQLGLTITATDGRLIVTPAELLDDDILVNGLILEVGCSKALAR